MRVFHLILVPLLLSTPLVAENCSNGQCNAPAEAPEPSVSKDFEPWFSGVQEPTEEKPADGAEGGEKKHVPFETEQANKTAKESATRILQGLKPGLTGKDRIAAINQEIDKLPEAQRALVRGHIRASDTDVSKTVRAEMENFYKASKVANAKPKAETPSTPAAPAAPAAAAGNEQEVADLKNQVQQLQQQAKQQALANALNGGNKPNSSNGNGGGSSPSSGSASSPSNSNSNAPNGLQLAGLTSPSSPAEPKIQQATSVPTASSSIPASALAGIAAPATAPSAPVDYSQAYNAPKKAGGLQVTKIKAQPLFRRMGN